MKDDVSIIKKGQVEMVDDTADGLRIKIRIKQDGTRPLAEIPYSFPLLPKTFQSVPKIGEGAFVITTMSDSKESQRYYLGPIISQPQFQGKCDYSYGRGNAMSLISGGVVEPLEKISNYKETFGSFPNVGDVAMVGRGSQDIIMKNNISPKSDEIDIRCGIRDYGINMDKQDGTPVIGRVVFNSVDPTYIQLKYMKNISKSPQQEANSVINMVADKINIISNKDVNGFDLTDEKELIKSEDLDNIMSKLHQLPHGDTLIKLLRTMINAILTHVHPYAGMMPTVSGYVKDTSDWIAELDTILSKHVRIS